MKKVLLLIIALVLSVISSINISASQLPVQSGKQINSMSVDEGLKTLGLNPGDYTYKESVITSIDTDMTKYLGVNGYIKDKEYTPIEFLGITESYEYLEQGYIDSYVYFYTPYKFFINSKNYNIFDLAFNLNIMFQLNDNKMNITEGRDGWWFALNGSTPGMDAYYQDYESLSRSLVSSDDEVGSASEGVIRLRLRVYKKADLDIKRRYYVEKIVFDYEDYKSQADISSHTTPSIGCWFSAVKDDGEVDTGTDIDPGYTDTSVFTVNNKSVICVEAYSYIYNFKLSFQEKTNVFILLRNKSSGEYIDNCKAMQIIYKISGDKDYRSAIENNVGKSSFYKIGNVHSKQGQFGDMTNISLNSFKKNVMPYIEDGYSFEEYPQYYWSWNYKVVECKTVYIWTEVEAGTLVQGSCYVNGLHVEYDDNGNALGVYDQYGNKVEGVDYNADGVLLNPDGSIRVPESSKDVQIDNNESLLEKLVNMYMSLVDDVFNTNNTAYKIIGIVIICVPWTLVLAFLVWLFKKIFR